MLFVFTVAWRVLTFTGFTNDHYVHLARAQQLRLGDLPVRDFVDPGLPLMYVVSLAAEAIGGRAIATELAVVVIAFAVGAALTLLAASRLAGAVSIAASVTLAEILIAPRTYSYPKVLLYAAAGCVILGLAEAPTRRRLAGAALLIASAFLFRHDHGLYIGVASAAAVALAMRSAAPVLVLRRVAALTAIVAALLLPWALFVQFNGGLAAYFRSGIEFSRAEAVRTRLVSAPRFRVSPDGGLVRLRPVERRLARVQWNADVTDAERRALEQRHGLEAAFKREDTWHYLVVDPTPEGLRALADDPRVTDTTGLGRIIRPRWEELAERLSPARIELTPGHEAANAEAWLVYLFRALPVLCALAAFRRLRSRRERWAGESAAVIAISLLAVLVNAGFIRDALKVRLPDAIVPAALLGAWLLGIAFSRFSPRPFARATVRVFALAIVALTAAAIAQVADVREQFGRTGVTDGVDAVIHRARDVARRVSRVIPEGNMLPSRYAGALIDFVGYLQRCTSENDRIFVDEMLPEIFVMSGRGFAGGHVAMIAGYYTSPGEQKKTLERLRRESVPVVLFVLDEHDNLRAAFPRVYEYLESRYRPQTDIAVQDTAGIRMLVDSGREPRGTDAITGWPCFR